MAIITNATAAVIHLPEAMLVPGVETEVPDAILKHPGVAPLLEDGSIIAAKPAKPAKADDK